MYDVTLSSRRKRYPEYQRFFSRAADGNGGNRERKTSGTQGKEIKYTFIHSRKRGKFLLISCTHPNIRNCDPCRDLTGNDTPNHLKLVEDPPTSPISKNAIP